MCNRFRSSLKPTFKQIATRINEITNEIEQNDKDDEKYVTKTDYNALNEKVIALDDVYIKKDKVFDDVTFRPDNGDIDRIDKISMESYYDCVSANASLKLFEALYTKITALENENATLKEQISSLKPKYSWQEFYQGFTERVEFMGNDISKSHFDYNYDENEHILYTVFPFEEEEDDAEYLAIFIDLAHNTHYIRFVYKTQMCYLDEIKSKNITWCNVGDDDGAVNVELTLKGGVDTTHSFNYIFKKVIN